MLSVSALGVVEGSGKSGRDRSQSDVSVLEGTPSLSKASMSPKSVCRGKRSLRASSGSVLIPG